MNVYSIDCELTIETDDADIGATQWTEVAQLNCKYKTYVEPTIPTRQSHQIKIPKSRSTTRLNMAVLALLHIPINTIKNFVFVWMLSAKCLDVDKR